MGPQNCKFYCLRNMGKTCSLLRKVCLEVDLQYSFGYLFVFVHVSIFLLCCVFQFCMLSSYCVTEPMPAGVGTDLHDSESPQPQITKQRANTAVQPDQNHIEITKASLQSRPRPSVKNPSGILYFISIYEKTKGRKSLASLF